MSLRTLTVRSHSGNQEQYAYPCVLSCTAAGIGFPHDNGHPDSGTDRYDTVPEGE